LVFIDSVFIFSNTSDIFQLKHKFSFAFIYYFCFLRVLKKSTIFCFFDRIRQLFLLIKGEGVKRGRCKKGRTFKKYANKYANEYAE